VGDRFRHAVGRVWWARVCRCYRSKYAKMTAGGREAFVTTYLKSREGSTLKSYESGFRTLRKICQEKDLSIFRLHEEDRCVIMIEAVERGLSEAAFKQMMAGVAMINESFGDKQKWDRILPETKRWHQFSPYIKGK
jgi:hypothetical protein